MEKTFFGRLSDISENVFVEVFSVMNKRGQGFASGCTLLNVFFVLYATFFFYSVPIRIELAQALSVKLAQKPKFKFF